jgi:hypothetical protein
VRDARVFTALSLPLMVCGALSQFWVELLGQLYWAEILLPAVAIITLAVRGPGELFGNHAFRWLAATLLLMVCGYVISDLAASTPPEGYLRGWSRVAALATDSLSLCVLCVTNAWNLIWFCLGSALGGLLRNLMESLPLTVWKFGYGEPLAMLVAITGCFVPRLLGAAALAAVGALSIMLDFRSLGAALLLCAVIALAGGRAARAAGNLKVLVTLAVGLLAASVLTVWLLDSSQGEFANRREISNTGRVAAIRIGAQAIVDSPFIGYGSWGQGTQKYADMLYHDIRGEMVAAGMGEVFGRGNGLMAHSQLIQAWMEGGMLAASFFIAYGVLLVNALRRLAFGIATHRFAIPLLLLLLTNAWHLLMSPFSGFHRLNIAVTVTAIVIVHMLSAARESAATAVHRMTFARPANLLR